MFGDPAVTGKPAGDDLAEGKRTVLVALALDQAPKERAALLDARLGTDLSPQDVRELQEVIEDSGAPSEVEKVIAELTDRSLTALERAPITATARGVLHTLAMAATQRVV